MEVFVRSSAFPFWWLGITYYVLGFNKIISLLGLSIRTKWNVAFFSFFFDRSNSFTRATWYSSVAVDGRQLPERLSSPTDCQPFLNLWNYSGYFLSFILNWMLIRCSSVNRIMKPLDINSVFTNTNISTLSWRNNNQQIGSYLWGYVQNSIATKPFDQISYSVIYKNAFIIR